MQPHPFFLIHRLIRASLKATGRNAAIALALFIGTAQLSSAQTVTATKDDARMPG
jgi:hypothetical protein